MLPSPTLDQLLSARRILCVQPHYDDNDICAGGTLAALAARGAELIYLTVTDDLVGVLDPALPEAQAPARLKAEQHAAGEVIGVSQQLWLGYPDAGDFDYFELRRRIAGYLRQLRPDFVFTCDPWLPYEAHQDHIRTGKAVAEAAILYHLPRFRTDPAPGAGVDAFTGAVENAAYNLTGVAFYMTGAPNLTFDTSAHREQKRRALACYRSQFSPAELDTLLAELDLLERQPGGGAWCETFKLLTPRQLHIYPHA